MTGYLPILASCLAIVYLDKWKIFFRFLPSSSLHSIVSNFNFQKIQVKLKFQFLHSSFNQNQTIQAQYLAFHFNLRLVAEKIIPSQGFLVMLPLWNTHILAGEIELHFFFIRTSFFFEGFMFLFSRPNEAFNILRAFPNLKCYIDYKEPYNILLFDYI